MGSTNPEAPRAPGAAGRLMAALYDALASGMEREVFGHDRRWLLHKAQGRVLDVGAGTGANLPHYPWAQVSELVLLDPSAGMLDRARRKAEKLGVPARTVERKAEQLPFPDESMDTVVFTLSLCTIPGPGRALREAHRVLRADGKLLVLEHVRARDTGLAAWQDRLTPLWKLVAGGCHPNRDTRRAIEEAGFRIEDVSEARDKRIPLLIVQPKLIATAGKAAAPAGREG